MDLLDDDALLDIRRRGARTDPRAAMTELSAHEELPDRNSALSSWAANLGKPDAKPAKGGCHLCSSPQRYTCNQCSRGACAADYWVMFGLCRHCANEERVQRYHNTPEPEANNWLGGQ